MAFEDMPVDDGPDAYGDAEGEQGLLPEMVAMSGVDLAFELDEQTLGQIAHRCLESYKRDKAERADWERAYDRIMKLVRGEREAKTFPWPGASNVKYPLIMKAALKFGARAYPAIVNGTDVVKSAAMGNDDGGEKRARGDRVASFMNYQLLMDMPEWDSDTDRLCHALPLQGTMFRQVIWDSEYSRPLTTLLSGKDLVVTQNAKDLETVPHFAKEFPLFVHQISEKMAGGTYRKADLGIEADKEDGENQGEQDMLECHCRYDLDDDGYDEPYIAVIHKESETLLSLKAGFWPSGVERNPETGEIIRIRRHVEFVKYEFLPDPEGRFYGIGFGQLLLEHSEMVNTMVNQLIDAATDQNAGGGFIGQGVNLAGGNIEFAVGEWKLLNHRGDDLRKALVPRPTAQPSPVMFSMLSLMLEAAQDLASDQDIMSGNAPANTPATTVLAMIEEGMKVFNSIYKRIYRSLTREFRLMGKLNAAYLPPESYTAFLDGQEPADPQMDFSEHDRDILPVADPSMTTSAQRLNRAQFLMQVGAGNPMLDQREIMKRVLEAASIDNIEALMPPPNPQQQQQAQQQMMIELRKAMAEIMSEEASATEDQASARLKMIEGDIKAQEAALERAAMRLSLQRMTGGVYGPEIYGPPVGGMGGIPQPPAQPEAVQPPQAPFGADQAGLDGNAMGAGQPGPMQPPGDIGPGNGAGF